VTGGGPAYLEMLTTPPARSGPRPSTALLQRAGFKLERIIPTATPVQILEAVPV
jgi:hypothetical protein